MLCLSLRRAGGFHITIIRYFSPFFKSFRKIYNYPPAGQKSDTLRAGATYYDTEGGKAPRTQDLIFRRNIMGNCLCNFVDNNSCLIWVIIAVLIVLCITCGGCL